MDNQSSYLQVLFSKYSSGTASKAEVEDLLVMLSEGKYDSEIISTMQTELSDTAPNEDLDTERWSAVLYEIQHHIASQPTRKSSKLWTRIGIAAAVATIIFSAGMWFYKGNQKHNDDQLVSINDVSPGKSGATLTLANGRKIRLTNAADGELAKEAGVVISKTADGQLIYQVKDENNIANRTNILTTENGETYQVQLPDGTSVWLNAGSSLKYPASFVKLAERQVELSGEGYFEVAKDKLHPFIVKSDGQEVRVLGTHFNIKAYADEPAIATTLVEGSVKLVAGSSDRLLKPGEEAMNHEGNIKVGKANMEAVLDWKNEEFFLDKMDFRVAMRKIARWYNIDVIYNGSVPVNLEAGGWIPRNNKLSDVLKSIELTGQVHFRIEGRKLYVSK